MDRVWINGCFDIIHRGHIELINYAAQFGIVRAGIDADERVTLSKGKTRPFNTLSDRMYVISNIKNIDSLVSFSTNEELENCIKTWKPKYIIVGDDYKDKKVIGSQHCEKVLFFKKIDGYSTTNIIG